jgi:hypothetical protein
MLVQQPRIPEPLQWGFQGSDGGHGRPGKDHASVLEAFTNVLSSRRLINDGTELHQKPLKRPKIRVGLKKLIPVPFAFRQGFFPTQ